MFAQCDRRLMMVSLGDQQRMISTPDKPTRVFIGENVSLVWRYYQPAHLTLVEVIFGHWKSTHIDPKLVVVNGSSGVSDVQLGHNSLVSWAGNLTFSLVVFILRNVQPSDGNVVFGMNVDFGLLEDPLQDTVRLQVEAKRKWYQDVFSFCQRLL